MPRLVPYHQMEEPCCSNSDEAPQIVDATRSENEETGHEESVPKIAITPSVTMNELVEQLMSHLAPDQRKQFADVIKSKVVDEFDKNKTTSNTQISPPIDGSVEEETWEAHSKETGKQQKSVVDNRHSEHCEISSYGSDFPVEEKEGKIWSEEKAEGFSEGSGVSLGISPPDSGQQDFCEDETSYFCQSRIDGSEEETKKKIEQKEELLESFIKKAPSSESSLRERILELELLEDGDCSFDANIEIVRPCSRSFFEQQAYGVDYKEEKRLLRKRRSSLKCEKNHGKKVKNVSRLNDQFVVKNIQKCSKEDKVKTQKVEDLASANSCSSRFESASEQSAADYEKRMRMEEDSIERLRQFRKKVKQRMNDQLNLIISEVEKKLDGLELCLGPRMHWELPWYRLNWKQVAQRLAGFFFVLIGFQTLSIIYTL